MRRPLTAGLLVLGLAVPASGALWANLASAAEPGAPPALSADATPADLSSTYGSGHFGGWATDDFGMPRFRYSVDENTDPRARQPELAGGTVAQHQVGNDHIVAMAYNEGYTQFWSQDRLSQWANLYQPSSQHYAGGYGYLNVDGKVLSLLYPDRPAGASMTRDFGVGYYRRALQADGLAVSETTYAPYGDDPVLLDQVTIRNDTSSAKRASWFEYWDVNPYDQSTGFQRNIGLASPAWDPASRTLSAAQVAASEFDTTPLSIFSAALNGPAPQFETSVKAFFGAGTRAAPAEVAADHLSGSIAAPTPSGSAGDTLFAYRTPVTVAPGDTVTLSYVYGMAHPEQIAGLVSKYRSAGDPFAASERSWARWLPKADFGPANVWVARELAWDAYLLRSASVFEEACGHHTITQGGYYQYSNGANLGYRSWLHYALPITYTDPALAREILRYAIGLQPPPPPQAQQNPYGVGQLCFRVDLGTSNDLDFWLLLAAGEYGLGMRDTGFFDEQLPYYKTSTTASAWQHIKEAFAHQETLLGPHGDYVMGSTGDWSDFSTQFEGLTESTLVLAQLAYAYPKLAELADLRRDHAFAAQLRAAAARNVATLRGEWTGKGWYSRGYSGSRQVGQGVIFEEPQPWALLAGAATPAQAQALVANVRRFLDGIGAPAALGGPARFGTTMSPARDDPDITERGQTPAEAMGVKLPDYFGTLDPNSPLQGAAEWPGGVWFDLNGWLTWAYASLDGVVPGARGLAWDEYTRNTLATHATLWPNHWDGTISLDDVCFGFYSAHPDQCGNGLGTTYEGQITEQPTWMVMNAIRLAGITPIESGYDIAPHLPFAHFSLRMPNVGIASETGRLRGYATPEGSGPIELAVHLPAGVSAQAVTTWANGDRVAHSAAGTVVRFTVPGRAGEPADWAITWSANGAGGGPGSGALCASRRRFVIRLRGPHDERLRSARVYVDGRRVRTRRRMRAVIDLRGRARSGVTVRIVGRTRAGRRVVAVRRYHLCVARRRHRLRGQGQGQRRR